MKTQKSFFIRWLLFNNEDKREQAEFSVIDIEHIQSGSKQRVFSLQEANLWMQEVEAEQKEFQEFSK